mgnify:CR=1 FL=1
MKILVITTAKNCVNYICQTVENILSKHGGGLSLNTLSAMVSPLIKHWRF